MHTKDPQLRDLEEFYQQIIDNSPADSEVDKLLHAIDNSDLCLEEIRPIQRSPVAMVVETHQGPTRRITIRLPTEIYVAYKAAALRRGIGYQTLIVEMLREDMNQPKFP